MSDGVGGGARDVDFEALVSAMGDAVYVLDAEGELLEFNAALERMSGYDAETLRENWPEILYSPAEVERFEAGIRETLRSGEPATVDATMQGADGDVSVEVTMTPLPVDDEYRGHIGIVRDVTERRRREAELERYETIVRAMPDEIYTLDKEGRFTSIVPPTGEDETTTGYEPTELVGEPVSIVMDEADIERGEALIRELLEDPDRQKASFEMELITRDGRRIPNENHIALLPTDDDEFRGTVGVLRDISERKTRQEALERQNERLEEFADVVSHDLRNPLNVAMGHVELLQQEYDDDRIDHVAEAVERMATIVDDVLSLTREGGSVTETTEISLAAVADAAWSTVENDRATLVVEADATVRADSDRFQRILENLYRNAVEHAGPDVTVRVGLIERDGTPVGFAVADDGPGIPPDEREQVFESGYTLATGGTGLGLAIVDRIAEAHGWTVAAAESADGGARFEFTDVEMG